MWSPNDDLLSIVTLKRFSLLKLSIKHYFIFNVTALYGERKRWQFRSICSKIVTLKPVEQFFLFIFKFADNLIVTFTRFIRSVSTAKLINSEVYSDRNKSHKFMFQWRRPNIEPWRRPYNIFNKSLKEKSFLVFWDLSKR